MRYLGEYSYADVSMALDIFARTDTAGFAPTPGQLLDAMQIPQEHGKLNATAAWGLVRKAIRQSGWGHAQEEFDRLPQAAQRAVGSPEQLTQWGYDEDFNNGVIMSQFIRAYDTELRREAEYAKVPERVRSLIDMTCTDLSKRITTQNEQEEPEYKSVPMPESAKRRMAEILMIEEEF